MFEQDYVMRLIGEIAKVLAKILFNINSETVTEDLSERVDESDVLESLLDLVDNGMINDAENRLYDMICNGDANWLEIALIFYTYLNDKTDEFLEENNFSREEVKMGIVAIGEQCGLGNIIDVLILNEE